MEADLAARVFRSREFWEPDWSLLGEAWRAQEWVAPLREAFGTPPETRSYVDETTGETHSYVLQTIEIVLPVTASAALVWQTDDDAQERTLLLREDGAEDAMLRWSDSHGHPYCLHPKEAILLGAAVRTEWPGVPLLLLDGFVGITTEAEADLWAQAKRGALVGLGVGAGRSR
ncbi:MAG: hypothetical protein AAGB05_09405 [Pseudomonadota bacterium]